MLVRTARRRRRRGFSVVESAIAYPVALLLLLGILVTGLGVFRSQQVASLAREGARWAAVHGPTYQQESNSAAPTSQDVLTNAVAPMMVGLDATALSCTLTMTAETATVTINYTWTPEAYFKPVTLSSTSVMPITY